MALKCLALKYAAKDTVVLQTFIWLALGYFVFYLFILIFVHEKFTVL